MRVVSIVGARPQFVKLAPVADAFAGAGIDHVIVHTGQHYDADMSAVFFADLDIPKPDINLEVGSGSHGAQTGAMLGALDPILVDLEPDWVLVYGDTNSTLAGALSAVKLHLPIAHLEAGLRSFNRRMPEEHNRILTDHASDVLLAPTETAMDHLAAEGLRERSVLVGDVMADVCLRVARSVADQPLPLGEHRLQRGGYIVATIHRAENTDDSARLGAIVRELQNLSLPVLVVAHPRLRLKASTAGIDLSGGSLRVIAPQPYPQMIHLVANARSVVTDSGGLQKEAYILNTPCATLRTETEWPETLRGGWNELLPDLKGLGERTLYRPSSHRELPFGSGDSATQVASLLLELSSHGAALSECGAVKG